MDRRDFLTARRTKLSTGDETGTAQNFRTNSGINPYAGTWTEQEVIHLLKRTMFGAKKADIDYFKTRTMSQSVDELLNPTSPNPAPGR